MIAVGRTETVIGFKSARKKLAFGVGTAGTPPSEKTIYEKLKGLESKGCIKVLSSERTGTRLRIFAPQEILGVIPVIDTEPEVTLGKLDFYSVPEHRKRILEREGARCFYCLAILNA